MVIWVWGQRCAGILGAGACLGRMAKQKTAGHLRRAALRRFGAVLLFTVGVLQPEFTAGVPGFQCLG